MKPIVAIFDFLSRALHPVKKACGRPALCARACVGLAEAFSPLKRTPQVTTSSGTRFTRTSANSDTERIERS